MLNRRNKAILVAFLILLVTFWHYATSPHHTVLHVLHRELYLIPIVLAAYWFGKKGGVITAVLSTVLFLPKIFLMNEHAPGAYDLNNVLEILTFILVGYFVGKYQDVRKSQFTTIWTDRSEKPGVYGRKVLVCIDNSKNASKAAQYVVETFARHNDMSITVLGLIREPSSDLFANPEEYAKARSDNESTISALVDDAKTDLLEGGFTAESVTTKIVNLDKESIAARILEEQRNLHYGTIVVGCPRMSKTEEFLFGNVAVKLVRDSDCPVVSVC